MLTVRISVLCLTTTSQSTLTSYFYICYSFFSQISGIFLTNQIQWVGCQGSRPELRGYTCSLWKLFHTLTVQAGTHPDALDDTGTSQHSQGAVCPDAHRTRRPGPSSAPQSGVGCKAVWHQGPGAPAKQAEGASFQVADPMHPMQSQILPSLDPARADALQPPSPSPGRACRGSLCWCFTCGDSVGKGVFRLSLCDKLP